MRIVAIPKSFEEAANTGNAPSNEEGFNIIPFDVQDFDQFFKELDEELKPYGLEIVTFDNEGEFYPWKIEKCQEWVVCIIDEIVGPFPSELAAHEWGEKEEAKGIANGIIGDFDWEVRQIIKP